LCLILPIVYLPDHEIRQTIANKQQSVRITGVGEGTLIAVGLKNDKVGMLHHFNTFLPLLL